MAHNKHKNVSFSHIFCCCSSIRLFWNRVNTQSNEKCIKLCISFKQFPISAHLNHTASNYFFKQNKSIFSSPWSWVWVFFFHFLTNQSIRLCRLNKFYKKHFCFYLFVSFLLFYLYFSFVTLVGCPSGFMWY